MNHLTPFPLAGILGLGAPELIVILAVGVAFPLLVIGIIAATLRVRHRQRQEWHDLVRLALEKGQPLPAPPEDGNRTHPRAPAGHGDMRAGLILIAVGGGFAVFMITAGAREAAGLGAIPGFIGIALFLFGQFSSRKSAAPERPPQT